jgi:hypothetical protein
VHAINFVHNPITFNLNGRTISEDKPYNGDLTDLEILGTRFAMNHKYNESGYNCVNYTEDFLYIAKQLGFNVESRTACKYANMTECHRFVVTKITFEPQSGKFKDYSKEYPYVYGEDT